MRHRCKERPPERTDIDNIVKRGANANDKRRFPQLLRRLRNACFLDDRNRRLPPQKRLVEQYRKDGLVLFLGAGISTGSGIPSWPKLADEVLEKSGILRGDGELDIVKKALPYYIAQFELAGLRLGYTEFVRTIYDALYGSRECRPLIHLLKKIPKKYKKQKNWPGWRDVLQALETNATLKAVGDLLIVEDDEEPRCNPQIHAVVTFNADNLLELYCQAKTSGRRLLKLVDRASVGEHPDTIPVYHLVVRKNSVRRIEVTEKSGFPTIERTTADSAVAADFRRAISPCSLVQSGWPCIDSDLPHSWDSPRPSQTCRLTCSDS